LFADPAVTVVRWQPEKKAKKDKDKDKDDE
jgi:hypothetical protein